MSGWRAGTEFEANKSLETALIKAVFDGERFLTPSGAPLPLLQPGSEVEIRVAAQRFQDQEQARLYVGVKSVDLLPAGTRLFAIVKGLPERDGFASPSSLFEPLSPTERQDRDYVRQVLERMRQQGIAHGVEPYNPDGAVEVVLEKPLRITLRGDKKPTLEGCDCIIPYFAHIDGTPDNRAGSLNHAFTRISEHFETSRISHTGNAFSKFFAYDGTCYQRLDVLAELASTKQKNIDAFQAKSKPSGNVPCAMTDAETAVMIGVWYGELVVLCKAALIFGDKHGYPCFDKYPQYKRAREIGELLHANADFSAMQKAVHFVNANVESEDGGQAALLEYGWSGIGHWLA